MFLANRQSTGCYNATHDYVMGTEGTLLLGAGQPRIETPDGKVKWQFEGEAYDMYQREHDVLFASIRAGKPKNDDLNLATSTLLAIMGRNAAYSGQQLTWEQALNSQVSLVPKPIDWNGEARGARPRASRAGPRWSDRMTLRVAAFVALAVAAVAQAAPLSSSQAAKAPDPKELAAVERIRARIEEQGKKTAAAKPAAYKVTIPNTTVSYGMAPIPAGEFTMGSAAAGAKPDEQPPHKVTLDAFWMQTHEVTWDAYLMFMFADQARERNTGRARRRAQPPDRAASRDELRPGQQRVPGDQHDPARRQQVRAVAEREDRRVLPAADRGGVGVRLPRRRRRPPAEPLDDVRLVQEELAAGQLHRRHVSHGRNEEAERVGPARHARQRHGVDARSVRALLRGRAAESDGPVEDAVPARRARRIVERRGRRR